jgi:hypothetical protein
MTLEAAPENIAVLLGQYVTADPALVMAALAWYTTIYNAYSIWGDTVTTQGEMPPGTGFTITIRGAKHTCKMVWSDNG